MGKIRGKFIHNENNVSIYNSSKFFNEFQNT